MTDFEKWSTNNLIGEVVWGRPPNPGRAHLAHATGARTALFSRLKTPKSIKGWKKKP